MRLPALTVSIQSAAKVVLVMLGHELCSTWRLCASSCASMDSIQQAFQYT